MQILAIDIGGTKIKCDLYNEFGYCLNKYSEYSTEINMSLKTNNISEQVLNIVDLYTNSVSVDGVAIATAGVVDSITGRILYSGYTIPQYTGTDLCRTINNKYPQIPVAVENDVNCAALGEKWLGVAKDVSNFALITVGTGIGGAIVLNGQLLRGFSNTAGEVGYIPIGDSDWQSQASTTSLLQSYSDKCNKTVLSGYEFFADIAADKKEAKECLHVFIVNLVKGLLCISYICNPEMLVLGGGIMENKLLLPLIQAEFSGRVVDYKLFSPKKIVAAELGNSAGRLGAVYNFLCRRPN